ncbi:MAG: hypothetical protein GKR89_33380 [Candidatus Latescibacteria bacterium]|nr:hypothetical protein [Candidatus Latescibacterota bacterium]
MIQIHPYRRRLVCSGENQQELVDFPLLIEVQDPALRAVDQEGHMVVGQGPILAFTEGDDGTDLAWELESYDGTQGLLRAWVRVPRLNPNTELYLHYGGEAGLEQGDIWSGAYQNAGTSDQFAGRAYSPGPALTVEAWVHSDQYQLEAMQCLVSQWAPLESFGQFAAYDAGGTDGLDTAGYFGSVFDGRYVYWCPIRGTDQRTSVHGRVLRLDTHADFKEPTSWEAYDASYTDGLHTAGYYGGAFDGRYVIFNPRDDGQTHHSRFLRYDTHRLFKDPAAWSAADAGIDHSGQGLAFDGRYLYRCPGYTRDRNIEGFNDGVESGLVVRVDTWGAVQDPATYRTFDTSQLHPGAVCFDGGAFDGRYIYLAPLGSGVVVRLDTQGDFGAAASWQHFDAGSVGMGANVGIVFDGVYLYFVSYAHSTMVRYDSRAPFADPASWQAYAAGGTDGVDTGGFDGGFFDGRFVYFVPFTRPVPAGSDLNLFHGNYLRYDTAGSFTESASWCGVDAEKTDGLDTLGWNGGAFDGRFFYTAPWRGDQKGVHGRVQRLDTLGDEGTFSLRWCDVGTNGGLNAAVLGPSFLVNTDGGVRSVAARRGLQPGWHHLAGVYDGRAIKLYIDGQLVAQQAAKGPLVHSQVPVSVGSLSKGTAAFTGNVEQVRLAATAHSDAWLAAVYQNLVRPRAELGPEEGLA